jgi:hypothetical protein
MPTEWLTPCPCCGERITLTKSRGRYICPECSCEFRHNYRRWFVGAPLAVVAFFATFLTIVSFPDVFPIAFAVLAPLPAALIMYAFPYYVVVSDAGTPEKA